MATTTKESFKQFASNLNITDGQGTVVSNCRTNVVAKIREKLSLYPEQPSKLIGSYDRDTLIKYLKERDVDVMVVLHYGENKDWDNDEGATKALNRFKIILQDAYPNTPCAIDRNCVTMKLSEFRLDVVPAFRFTQGYYTIPDTYRGKWLQTDPTKFADEVTRINKNMLGDFVPLMKMIKGWNREFSNPLRGFHLECIMINHYKNYTQTYTFESMVKTFLGNLPTYLSLPTHDPINGERVDHYMDNKSLGNSRDNFVARAKKAAKLSEEAYSAGEIYPSIAIGNRQMEGTFWRIFPSVWIIDNRAQNSISYLESCLIKLLFFGNFLLFWNLQLD